LIGASAASFDGRTASRTASAKPIHKDHSSCRLRPWYRQNGMQKLKGTPREWTLTLAISCESSSALSLAFLWELSLAHSSIDSWELASGLSWELALAHSSVGSWAVY
jgi:hypothetical protein